ncbi:hypothetical protein FB451DRAFT_1422252 [Mycena latifolia]|nr:hypothetical protein FB451DRAFT_1422252 [Mycena latifolia]
MNNNNNNNHHHHPLVGCRSDELELRALDICRQIMPSTTRVTLGEVRRPITASSTSHPSPTHFHPASSLPPFRPQKRLIPSSKPPSKTVRRLRFIVLHRHPPHSLRAACARFRLARQKSPCRQFNNAAVISAALEQFEARAQCILSQIQMINDLLGYAQNLLRMNLRASSSFPSTPAPNFTQHFIHIPRCGLATRSTVAPPESSSRALPPPPGPFPEDAIT